MRIALVSQEYPPETAHGGIATQTHAKAHGLAALGHEVHVVSHSISGARVETLDGPVRVTRVPGFDDRLPLHTEPARWVTWSAAVAAAVQALHAEQPLDLVDFPEWGAEGYVHLLNRAPWSSMPTVVQLHGPLVMLAHTIGWPPLDSELYRTGTAMEGACLRLADAVYSSSACSAEWCATHYGLDLARIPVIHAGVDTTTFVPSPGGSGGRPTIVFAGRLARSKGVDTLLKATLQLAPEIPGLRLVLIGQGDDGLAAELAATARAAGQADLLELAGFVPRDELSARFAGAHVFAAPSRYEGGPGFVYLEAMACGLPVIGPTGSGVAEIIADGDTGLLVSPGDPDALAGALRRLLLDAPVREAMGRAARQYAVEEADSATCVRRIEAFYLDVVATTRLEAAP